MSSQLCLAVLIVAATFGQADDHGVAVTITHEKTEVGTSMKLYTYSVNIRNGTERQVWIVVQRSTRRDLPEKAEFKERTYERESEEPPPSPFRAFRREGDGGTIAELRFGGYDEFYAYCIPGGGVFTGLPIHLHSPLTVDDPKELSAFVVDDLLVNGEISVDKWLPYSLTSDKAVHLDRGIRKPISNLDWDKVKDAPRPRSDYRLDLVKSVLGTNGKRMRVKIQFSKDN